MARRTSATASGPVAGEAVCLSQVGRGCGSPSHVGLGALELGKVLEHARSLPAQTEVTVKGVHFVQEDSPDEIGRAIAGWMKTLS